MTDLELLRDFFDRYSEAFAAGDLPGISGCYEVPVLILSDASSVVVTAREEIEAAFDGAAEAYRSQGLVDVRPTILHQEEITAGLVSVDVGWDYLDERGQARGRTGIATWCGSPTRRGRGSRRS